MKKILTAIVSVLASVVMAVAWIDPTSSGTVVGNGFIGANVANAIAIGAGVPNGTNEACLAMVTASGAIQIGNGSNGVANTIKFGSSYLTTTNVPNTSAALLQAGSAMTAVNINAATNLAVATGLAAGGTFPQENGSALKALNPAAISSGTVTGLTLDATSYVPSGDLVSGTVGATLTVTPRLTLTAAPRLNAALATVGAVTVVITNAPTGTSTTAKWVQFISPDGSTNAFPAFQLQ